MLQAWFMVAVTPVMHNFWDEKENSQGRLNETINFFKVSTTAAWSSNIVHDSKQLQLQCLHAMS